MDRIDKMDRTLLLKKRPWGPSGLSGELKSLLHFVPVGKMFLYDPGTAGNNCGFFFTSNLKQTTFDVTLIKCNVSRR